MSVTIAERTHASWCRTPRSNHARMITAHRASGVTVIAAAAIALVRRDA
jgi:hypothetical protein